jgi:hypothetical protein
MFLPVVRPFVDLNDQTSVSGIIVLAETPLGTGTLVKRLAKATLQSESDRRKREVEDSGVGKFGWQLT